MPILESKVSRSSARRIALGVVVAVLFGFQCWRIARLGLVLPLGLTPATFGLVAVGIGLIAALLIALIAMRSNPAPPAQPRLVKRALLSGNSPASLLQQRLAKRKASLEKLDRERGVRCSSGAASIIGDRIVWGELLDLELQDLDEQVSRLSQRLAAQSQDATSERKESCNRQLTNV